jgi:hypothetical protein
MVYNLYRSTLDIEESNHVKYSMPLLYLPVICFGIIAGKRDNLACFRILLTFYLDTLRLLLFLITFFTLQWCWMRTI